ncbi:GMC family oxidoreductase [Gordonia sp. TBRC 11910]|uniref:Cholesterol oxidase n=1 Tax=Gordonia asplenii TaxID=2725283 RepID=A0A848KY11_9ACTN|nr:GMC oxidoreductase [Gordonia asplenii]NMO03634.1 GMC family oxidoreductase [Gordonia asplenii]
MTDFSRRTLLGGAAAVGATVAVGAARATASAAPIRLRREEHRVIVVGSGFGGGVTALRLTRAGVPVTLLERGKRWRTGPDAKTFPHAAAPDARALWHGSARYLFGRPIDVASYVGLFDAVPGENMTPICAAGLGGGSLVYQGMTLQPAQAVFDEYLPNALDWRRMNRVHYPRVARMLGLQTAPDELIRSATYAAPRTFARNVRRAGMPLSKIPMPIDWRYAVDELHGKMARSYTNGDCSIGVNNGGKHSVDVTYLAQAQATGRLSIRTLHEVTDVERARSGRWVVRVNRTDETGRVLEQIVMTAPTLVMAAGAVHTNRLLVRASALGHITDLPDGLGGGWGTNADRIYTWTDPANDFGVEQGGPVVYGSLNWSDPTSAFTVIQASIPPLGVDAHSTMLVGYGVSRSRGRYVYDTARDQAVLKWPSNGDAAIQRGHIDPAVHRIAGPTATLVDTNALLPTTWHPLGGASMGTVCDLDGRVTGQRGLYVIDGALIPGTAAACNPSMTIAAVAERALDNIVARDVGTVI